MLNLYCVKKYRLLFVVAFSRFCFLFFFFYFITSSIGSSKKKKRREEDGEKKINLSCQLPVSNENVDNDGLMNGLPFINGLLKSANDDR